MKLGPEQNVNMPLKTVISLITLVSIFTFSYFQITERLNNLETQDTLMQSDLLKKAEQTPKNLEIFLSQRPTLGKPHSKKRQKRVVSK